MRSKKLLTILFFIAMFATAFNLVGDVYDAVLYSIEDVPNGNFVSSVASPDGQTVINCYKVETILGNAIRCSVSKKGEEERNIYWDTEADRANVYWIDNKTIKINDVSIDISDDIYYDSRGNIEEIRPLF